MTMVAGVVRRLAVLCAVAIVVWVVQGPILSTAGEYSARPHGWSAAPAAETALEAAAIGATVAECLDGPQPDDHGHMKVFVPVDSADTGAIAAPDSSVVLPDADRAAATSTVRARGAPPARPPINVLTCVSRT